LHEVLFLRKFEHSADRSPEPFALSWSSFYDGSDFIGRYMLHEPVGQRRGMVQKQMTHIASVGLAPPRFLDFEPFDSELTEHDFSTLGLPALAADFHDKASSAINLL
jgi:hypothetical protein